MSGGAELGAIAAGKPHKSFLADMHPCRSDRMVCIMSADLGQVN